MPGIFDTVLDANVQALLRREQRLLVELRETLEREQAEERRRVDELLATLEDLFTLVIVGEFNAGKSSLINALFGAKLRTEGPIPVDDVISVLRYAERSADDELRRNVETANIKRLGDDYFRICIARDDRESFICLLVDTEVDPPKVKRDPSGESNSVYRGG